MGADEIRFSTPNLHMYQIVIVDNVLRYSRDLQSRHTLWIPDDFLVEELKEFLEKTCIDDPSVHPTVGNPAGRIISSHKTRSLRMEPIELLRLREREPDLEQRSYKEKYPKFGP